MAHLKVLLALLKDGFLTLKLRKFFFLHTRFEYLGHIVSPGCLHVASKTFNAVE